MSEIYRNSQSTSRYQIQRKYLGASTFELTNFKRTRSRLFNLPAFVWDAASTKNFRNAASFNSGLSGVKIDTLIKKYNIGTVSSVYKLKSYYQNFDRIFGTSQFLLHDDEL